MSALFELFAKLMLDSSEYDEGLEEAKTKASGFGGAVKTAAKVGVAAFAAVGGAAIGAGTALVKGTGAVAEYGDNIDKMSQKMGLSAEAYQEWDAVMQHSGTSMEAMKASMKTLANAAETNSKAFEQLGISQEELASMSQQDLFERTISALQNVEDETTRTYLAGKTLGRGATELGALLNTSAEDTQAMRDRVRELGGVMSDDAVKAAAAYQDSLQDMNTAISSVKRGLLSDFLPSITQAMNGITEIFGGDGEKGGAILSEGISGLLDGLDSSVPKFAERVFTIVDAISNAFSEHLPSIVEKGAEIVVNLATGMIEKAPEALSMGMNIIGTIVTSVTEALPSLVEAGVSMISSISSGLTTQIPKMITDALPLILSLAENIRSGASSFIDAGIDLLLNLTQGIMDSLPSLIAEIPKIIIELAGVINDNAPKLLIAGGKMLLTILQGIVESIPALIASIPQIFEAFTEVWEGMNWLNLGKMAIQFITNGVKALATNIPAAIKAIATNATAMFKSIDWASAGKTAITLITGAIMSMFTSIPSALANIGSAAWDAISSMDWYSIGSNIISGIANGIWNGAHRIADAARDAARNALNAAKNFLGIQSPSKVFRVQVGEMIGAGMALGIKDSEKEVNSAIDNLDAKLFNGLNRTYDYSPNIELVSKNGEPVEGGRDVYITNNITVDGAENPEDYATRLVRELELQMRTA